jgi:hypothetical protein
MIPTIEQTAASAAVSIPIEDKAARTLSFGIAIQLALLVPSALAAFLDTRTLNDINIWTKPIKFQLSLALLMATMLVLLPLLTRAWRASRTVRWSATATAFAGTFEIAYITVQSARGRGSHYFVEDPIEATMYSLMGLGAVTLVVAAFVVGFAILRSSHGQTRQGLRLGSAVGLMMGAVLTLVTAAALSASAFAPEIGHWIGGDRSDASGIPLLGWSTTGGDLRVAHFFATHLMQALPVLGLLADKLRPASARGIVFVGAALGTLGVAATFLQAAKGYPFLPL